MAYSTGGNVSRGSDETGPVGRDEELFWYSVGDMPACFLKYLLKNDGLGKLSL